MLAVCWSLLCVDEIFSLVGENGKKNNSKFRGKAENVLSRRNFSQDFEELACFHKNYPGKKRPPQLSP